MADEVVTELTPQEMVDWANAALDREREQQEEIERLRERLELKDSPFPKDFDALDLAVERNKAYMAENERLRAALAESCDENRLQVLEEGPWSTDTCPIAGKLGADNKRLREVVALDEKELERLEGVADSLRAALEDAQASCCCAAKDILDEALRDE